jgi:hypothetical protein
MEGEKMKRAEGRLYRMQLKVAASKKWAKMVERVDIGKEPKAYQPVPFHVNGHLRRITGYSCVDKIEVSKEFYKARSSASPYRHELMDLVKHEMVHTWLAQNGVSDVHGPLFKTGCHLLGLHDPNSKEAEWKYQYVCCVCGWWLKSSHKQGMVRCGHCLKRMVTRAEYNRLKKMAEVGSKLIPVKIEDYIVMEVKVNKPCLRIRTDAPILGAESPQKSEHQTDSSVTSITTPTNA